MISRDKKSLQSVIKVGSLLFFYTIFLCMQSELALFSKGISGTDSSVFRYIAYLMQHGYVPYRDSFDHKGLLIYLIDYIGMSIHPVYGIWLIELIMMFTAVVYSYKLARLFASKAAALLTVLTAYALLGDCFRGGNMTEEYALPFISVSLFLFIKYFLRGGIKKREIFCCGLCFAAVCLLRINMIAVWLFCIPAVFVRNAYERRWKELGCQTLCFLSGFLVFLLPNIAYLIWNHALSAFWNIYFIFNFSYTGYHGLRSRLDCYQFFIDQPSVYLAAAGLIYALYAFWKGKFPGQVNRWIFAAVSGSFALTFPLMCMSGRNDITYEMVLVPVLVMPFCFFYLLVLHTEHEKAISAASFFIVFFVVVTLVIPPAVKTWDKCLDQNRYLTNDTEDVWLQTVRDTVYMYCTRDDTISVFGNKDIIYLLCDKMSASPYSYQFPLIEVRREIYQEYLEDLAHEKPKIIVINESFAEEYVDIFKEWLEENGYNPVDEGETIFLRQA